jgi:hypothetical protein
MGQNCLKCVTSHYDKSSPVCTLCDTIEIEDICHLLFKCPRFNDIRNAKWKHVQDTAPLAMTMELDKMSAERRTVFILSGFQCDYVEEWNTLYTSVADFCYDMYKTRRDCETTT